MDFSAFLDALRRRPWLALVMLALVAVAVLGTSSRIQPVHESSASVLLVPPPLPGAENPLLSFSRALDITAGIIGDIVDQPARLEALEAAGLTADVSVDLNTDAPILEVEAVADRPQIAVETAAAMVEAIETELEARQAEVGAPPELFIRPFTLVAPDRAAELNADRIRAGLAVAVLALAIGAVIVVRVDRWLPGSPGEHFEQEPWDSQV